MTIDEIKEKLKRQISYLESKGGDSVYFNDYHNCLSYVKAVLKGLDNPENAKLSGSWMRLCNEAVKRATIYSKHI